VDEQTTMKFFKSEKDDERQKVEEVQNEVISFSEIYKSYCVGIVDIVNSTQITAILSKPKMCQYYTNFLNSMASIVRKHGGIIVKNIGDSLLYYFPKTSDVLERSSFVDSLECGMEMVDALGVVNAKMREGGLPSVNYRVSSDHGMVMSANSTNSFNADIFGPTVNLCSKLNKMTKPNTMVIGGDLYQIVKSFKEYRFESVLEYNNGLKLQYPVYSIKRNIS